MTGRRIMTADEIRRAVIRISHEIVEKQAGTAGLVLVGIQRRGVPLARRLAEAIVEQRGRRRCPSARSTSSSTATTRDSATRPLVKGTDIPFEIDGATVVLVDDVLYTGRTVRAAMDALREFGRPRAVRLAVLVDRGHRELPIRADHVGKNVPTSREEVVRVRVREVDGEDAVDIEQAAARRARGRRRARGCATPAPSRRRRRAGERRRPPATAAAPLAPSPPARHGRADLARRSSSCSTRPTPWPRSSPGARPRSDGAPRRRRDEPVLRGLDADPGQLRGRREAPLGGRRERDRERLLDREGRVAARHDAHARGARGAGAGHAPRDVRARRTSSRGSSAARWSTPATAGTPTRPRRCSTCTRSGATCPAARCAGGRS